MAMVLGDAPIFERLTGENAGVPMAGYFMGLSSSVISWKDGDIKNKQPTYTHASLSIKPKPIKWTYSSPITKAGSSNREHSKMWDNQRDLSHSCNSIF